MNKITGWVAVVAVIAVLVGAGVYVSRAGAPPARAAVVLDLSDSRVRDCGAAGAMARELIKAQRMGAGSKLYLFGTGGEDTADEPQLLGSFDVRRSNRVLEDKAKGERQEEEIYGGLSSRCEEAPLRTRSPIFLTAKRVVEHMRARGCDGKTPCAVYVQTDGEELSEPTIKKALAGRRAGSRKGDEMPAPINNSGIQIRICGFAQVSRAPKKGNSPRSAIQSDVQREVWQRLFTEPQAVIIEPHCPQQ